MPLNQITSDSSQLISYGTFKILTSKIHATYDASKVLSEIDKVVVMSAQNLFDYLKSKYPNEDSNKLRGLLGSEGIDRNSKIQIRAVDLIKLGEMTSDDK